MGEIADSPFTSGQRISGFLEVRITVEQNRLEASSDKAQRCKKMQKEGQACIESARPRIYHLSLFFRSHGLIDGCITLKMGLLTCSNLKMTNIY